MIETLARRLFPAAVVIAALAVAGCGRADGIEAEPLPPLDRPSAEARAGLPEIAGQWRLTGVELAAPDTAAARAAATADAALLVQTQRLDSVAAFFRAPGARLPLVGEVRRDGTVALAGRGPAGESVVFAGHLVGDTLWVELVIPAGATPWPDDARAALVRRRGGPRFARLAGSGRLLFVERPPPPVADSVPADSAADSAAAPPAGEVSEGAVPARTPPPPRPASEQPRVEPEPEVVDSPADSRPSPPPDTSSSEAPPADTSGASDPQPEQPTG